METVRSGRPRRRGGDLPRGRLWLKRVCALLMGLVVLGTMELGLRFAGWPVIAERDDPLIGFQASSPLFVEDDSNEWMTTAENRLEFFRSDRFRTAKGENEFRVFCLGGSTVQGRPFEIETAFTTWLELSLTAAEPSTTWQVVNCGGVSYASYRLVPILNEVLQYDPDLIVLYTGHNEFLEDRTYASIVDQPRWQSVAHQGARHLYLYRALRALWMQLVGDPSRANQRELLAGEVQARLDFQGGLDLFVRDDAWSAAVVEHYRINLGRMVQLCQAAQVPVVIANPVENLRNCGPFKSQFSDGVDASARAQIQQTLEDAVPRIEDDAAIVLPELQELKAADPRYALTHYLIGHCYDRLEQPRRARASYERARDEDVCPLRMTGPLHEALWSVVEEWDVPCLDIAAFISERSTDGIPDQQWLVDHVHPTIEGHQEIASAIHGWMMTKGWGPASEGWQQRRDELYQEHYNSLDYAYFEHGRMRREGLRQWTRGQAFGALPVEDKIMPRFEGEMNSRDEDR